MKNYKNLRGVSKNFRGLSAPKGTVTFGQFNLKVPQIIMLNQIQL